MDKLVTLANVSDVKPGRSKLVQVHGIGIAIFNTAGAFYALQDCCTGDGGSLSEGILTGSMIQCVSDNAVFYLPTGECIDPQNLKRLAVCRVIIERDEIKISLTEGITPAGLANTVIEADQRWAC